MNVHDVLWQPVFNKTDILHFQQERISSLRRQLKTLDHVMKRAAHSREIDLTTLHNVRKSKQEELWALENLW